MPRMQGVRVRILDIAIFSSSFHLIPLNIGFHDNNKSSLLISADSSYFILLDIIKVPKYVQWCVFPYCEPFLYQQNNQAEVLKLLEELWAMHRAAAAAAAAAALNLARMRVLAQTGIAASEGIYLPYYYGSINTNTWAYATLLNFTVKFGVSPLPLNQISPPMYVQMMQRMLFYRDKRPPL